jgi:DNA-binding NarL/FixJ family response regulator
VTASELEAAPLLHRIDDLARRARVKVSASRRAPDPDAPTSRELDVLGLLAEGRTNPQIADALFLSPKTVGIHVSHLLDKLGASTRGEAVAVARRRGLIE